MCRVPEIKEIKCIKMAKGNIDLRAKINNDHVNFKNLS